MNTYSCPNCNHTFEEPEYEGKTPHMLKKVTCPECLDSELAVFYIEKDKEYSLRI